MNAFTFHVFVLGARRLSACDAPPPETKVSRFITITADISPATGTTCGDGQGGFCRFMTWDVIKGDATCFYFGALADVAGWAQRDSRCVDREVSPEVREMVKDILDERIL